MYDQSVLEDLRQSCDIVDVVSGYVALRQQGANFMGLCPFHRERTPSFSVSATQQFFHCFGCGEGGNVYSFIMKIENFGFMDTVKFLADKIGYRLPERAMTHTPGTTTEEKNRMYEAYKLAARFYYENLQNPTSLEAAEYLTKRGMSPPLQRKFGLGFSSQNGGLKDFLIANGFDEPFLIKAGLALEGKNGYYDRFRGRLMFPIFDVAGKVIGFGGRIIGEGEPKYLNSPETPVFDKSRT
ncbi:MAG: CHC2 zinc finger domain-containing protein, partial [Defluviitaleaceae bacterium]|nr:CHC2 zinc finger domain-containing protein [Defluviitaleaceae bacterium]